MRRFRAAAVGAALAVGAVVVPAGVASAAVDPQVTACPPDVTSDVGFTDVNDTTAFANSIYCVADLGIAAGTGAGAYSPNATLTRRQMATFYYRLACSLAYEPSSGSDTGPTPEDCASLLPTPDKGFPDVAALVGPGEQRDAINFLAGTGVVLGKTNGNFDPNGTLTRIQMAAFIDRFQAYAGHKRGADPQAPGQAGASGDGNTGYPAGPPTPFSDVGGDSLGQNVRDIYAAGITAGATDTEYQPNAPLKRQQMAEFLARQLESNSPNGLGNWVFETVGG